MEAMQKTQRGMNSIKTRKITRIARNVDETARSFVRWNFFDDGKQRGKADCASRVASSDSIRLEARAKERVERGGAERGIEIVEY